jgi:catechol 2,3-dioxygenase-like lactoylglutathione lyase family enzyme
MSKLFGPVVQQGYVVPDIEAAMQHWLARGVGPFFVEVLEDLPAVVGDTPTQLSLTAAFAYWGDQQIEVISQQDDGPSIYNDFLEQNPAGGLQHVAVWVDEIDATLAELRSAGRNFTVAQRYGDGHAYLDSTEEPGIMVQLMAHNEAIDTLFGIIKGAAEDWDGHTDPIRKIDWSTGKPVVQSR